MPVVGTPKRLIASISDAKEYIKHCVNERRRISWEYNALNINSETYDQDVIMLAEAYLTTWKEEEALREVYRFGRPSYLPQWVLPNTKKRKDRGKENDRTEN